MIRLPLLLATVFFARYFGSKADWCRRGRPRIDNPVDRWLWCDLMTCVRWLWYSMLSWACTIASVLIPLNWLATIFMFGL